MTENDKPGSNTAATEESPETPATDAAAGEPAAASAPPDRAGDGAAPPGATTAAETPATPRGAGRGTTFLAWLAFIIALGAAGYLGYQWWLEQGATAADDGTAALQSALGGVREDARENARALADTSDKLADTTQKLAAIEDRLSSMRRAIDQASQGVPARVREQVRDQVLEEVRGQLTDELDEIREQLRRQAAAADRVAQLEQRVGDNRSRLESLPARMDEMEQAMADLQVSSAGARREWLVGEAEHYMELANAQAQLAGNADLAALALQLADRRLRQIDDPAFTPVRRQLSEEITALQGVENVDVEGISLALASLADVVATLPLEEDVAPGTTAREDIGEELSGIDRAWAATKGAFSNLITVRRTDERLEPLLSPEAEYFLRTNIQLQLQTARLALLQGEPAVFRQSLEDVEAWLRRYFDADDKAVSGALETVAEIRASRVAGAGMPDVSGSLRALRERRAVAEGAE